MKNILIMSAGLPGTGKTHLIKRIMRFLPDYKCLDHTSIRRELGFIGVDPTGKKDRIVLDTVHERTSDALKDERGVIIDSVHRHRNLREERYEIAKNRNGQVIVIECICPRELSIERIKFRKKNIKGLVNDTNEREVYDRLAKEWESIDEDFKKDISHVSYIKINTENNNFEIIRHNQEAEKIIEIIKKIINKK